MTEKLRVGVIGANLHGSWGVWAHLPALAALEGLEASAVATSHIDSAEATAAQFGIVHAFGDPRQLVDHPDVDIVAICVRVPAHRELVMMALDAGKHVYCEWPLGRDSAEAEELHRTAEKAGVVHMVGLQSRFSPVLAHARRLILEGAIGTVRSAGFTHSVDWISQPYPSMIYLQDRSSGAHFLSIPGGHSVDALTFLLGDFATLTAHVQTLRKQLSVVGTGEQIVRTSADQIAVVGQVAGGAVATMRLSGASSPGTGIRLEINGDDGDLVIIADEGGHGIQMADLRLYRTTGPGALEEIAVPQSAYHVPAGLRHCPPLNVGEAYMQMAEAIRSGSSATPDFSDAVKLHRTLDRIEASARVNK